jgi:hypothetical protein
VKSRLADRALATSTTATGCSLAKRNRSRPLGRIASKLTELETPTELSNDWISDWAKHIYEIMGADAFIERLGPESMFDALIIWYHRTALVIDNECGEYVAQYIDPREQRAYRRYIEF